MKNILNKIGAQQAKIISNSPLFLLSFSKFLDTMGFTSTIPSKFELGFVRSRIPLPKTQSLSSAIHHVSFFSSQSSAVRRNYGLRWSQMYWVRCSERDDLFGTEEMLKTKSQPHEKVENAEKAVTDPSSDGKQDPSTSRGSSIRNVMLWVSAAVIFGIALGLKEGGEKASEYFAGYLLEQSLSVDNLFVFVLIFKYFKVPGQYQSRVLSYGIAGAVIFRAIMILLGTVALERFEAVNLVLASILLYSSYKLFSSEEEEDDLANNFIVKTCQKFIPVAAYYDGDRFLTIKDGVWKATPLLLTVAVIELSDIAFAVDSIPAVFGVTRDPFIVFTSNMFAISGLRSLYLLISESMSELEYLQSAIAVVLGFIGTKMILDFFGYHVSTEVSLGIVVTSLSAGVLLSLIKRSDS